MNRFTSMQNKWLKALEGGRYRQTTGQLSSSVGTKNSKYSYCCLGVMCNITDAEVLEHEPHDRPSRSLISQGKLWWREDGNPPRAIRKMFNLTSKGMNLCVEMNDDQNLSFKEIAAAIRQSPWKFFSNFKKRPSK